ncbi:hypothetical protein OKW45_003406 [Paraburkholderia sp. WSM4175]|uniref:hypothetical protein n=1 Tax=Paraburkholderia sp. WSM4175 TaxID=2991072 RepID=UPI003D2414E6
MATKRKATKEAASAPPPKRNPEALGLSGEQYDDPVKRGALIASSPVVRGAVTGRKYAEPVFGAELDLTAYLAELNRQAAAVRAGDLSGVEALLVTQANTLDMIFNQFARKAAFSEYLNQMQAHLSLALKAQAQCRATLEALAEIKNPRPLAFVGARQAGCRLTHAARGCLFAPIDAISTTESRSGLSVTAPTGVQLRV